MSREVIKEQDSKQTRCQINTKINSVALPIRDYSQQPYKKKQMWQPVASKEWDPSVDQRYKTTRWTN